jgi:hypothetical protein
MCGGIRFNLKQVSESELKQYYSEDLIERFKSTGEVESFFWHKQAVLPIIKKGSDKAQLTLWGNKEANIKLPKTGWARQESLNEGKWNWLKPEEVDILAEQGYEKKVWFKFQNGTKGVLVKDKDGIEHVYMITKEAGEKYKKETGHGREPKGEKSDFTKSE